MKYASSEEKEDIREGREGGLIFLSETLDLLKLFLSILTYITVCGWRNRELRGHRKEVSRPA